MKYTLCITQQCNLRCTYCYIVKKNSVMSLETAGSIINNIFAYTPSKEKIDIGFFGGEPLLEFQLLKKIVGIIEGHPSYSKERVEMDVVTNGTVFSDEIGEYLAEHNIAFCLSCDGPPEVQDRFRRYKDGLKSSRVVEKTIMQAVNIFPSVLVNAVYHPDTFTSLPHVVDYFTSFGIKQIYMNPDYSAAWSKEDTDMLCDVYGSLAEQYINFYLNNTPHHISVIDGKILAILKGGFAPAERCRMGTGEFAFAPSGNIYPCERLVGADDGKNHCIGHVSSGISNVRTCINASRVTNNHQECSTCSLSDYCMNWCGCSNFLSSRSYDKVSPFLCASEKAAIAAAFHAFQSLEQKLGHTYFERLMKFASPAACRAMVR